MGSASIRIHYSLIELLWKNIESKTMAVCFPSVFELGFVFRQLLVFPSFPFGGLSSDSSDYCVASPVLCTGDSNGKEKKGGSPTP